MDYFTFEIDGKKVGYYEESNEGGILYSGAHLLMQGKKFTNEFWIKHKDGKVLAYKANDSEYKEFNQADNVWPSSAISLLLLHMKDRDELPYVSFHEEQGEPHGEMTLKRNGNRIEEISGDSDTVGRYFTYADGVLVEYCWGGTAKSQRVQSLEEAKSGTVFADDYKSVDVQMYMNVSAEKVWEALVDKDVIKEYYVAPILILELKPRGKIMYGNNGKPSISGEIIEVEEGSRLVHTFSFAHHPTDAVTQVEYEITPIGTEMCMLTVCHSGFEGETGTYYDVSSGWIVILSQLKTWLETGKKLSWPKSDE